MLRSLAQHAEDAGVGRNHIPASCTGAMCCERTPFACQPPLQSRIRSVRAPATRRLAAAAAAAHHLSADTQCGRLRGPCWYCTVPVHRPPCCGPSPQLHPAWWARHAAGLPHTTLGLSGGLAVDEGSELRKVHQSVHLPTPTPPHSQG